MLLCVRTDASASVADCNANIECGFLTENVSQFVPVALRLSSTIFKIELAKVSEPVEYESLYDRLDHRVTT